MKLWLVTALLFGMTTSYAMTPTEVQHFVDVLGFSEAEAPRAIADRDNLVNSMSRQKALRCFERLHVLKDESIWVSELIDMKQVPLAKRHFEQFKQVRNQVRREACMTKGLLDLQQDYVDRLEQYFRARF